MKFNYRHTTYACYLGCITQAITVNLAPLLFVTFQNTFQISMQQLGLLIMVNFGTQILADLIVAKIADRIGYRQCVTFAHVCSFVGLIGLGVFPYLLPNAFVGLAMSTIICAIGGGVVEVLLSPIVEAIPNEEKSAAMSLLHSFYSWGQVGVVVLSTVYFSWIGIAHWRWLPMLWALVPLVNIVLFLLVPINTFGAEETTVPMWKLFGIKLFWVFLILMVCSGAAELAMSQWASMFAETGLKVSKTVGDLLGPCAFALLMGISRAFYGKYGGKIKLTNYIMVSSILCIGSYLLAVFSPVPILGLAGCALCGLSVGIMWPGVLSMSARYMPQGGTAMFGLLALSGDIGCTVGPGLVGFVSGAVSADIGLKAGLLCAIVFPIFMTIAVFLLKRRHSSTYGLDQ